MELAQLAKQEAVILTDRGLMDGSAYMKPECWQTLMDEKGWNEAVLRDRRYDAVIHLVTAANGASEFYNMANPSRYEVFLFVIFCVILGRTISAWQLKSTRKYKMRGWDTRISCIYIYKLYKKKKVLNNYMNSLKNYR